MDEQTPQGADTDPAPDPEPSDSPGAPRRLHPNSLANLRPPWTPGRSGNPSGLTKDGQKPFASALRASLTEELERSGGTRALAKRWIALAKKGNSTALASILERLDPIPKEQVQQRNVLEGLRLELTDGGASLTMLTASGPHQLTPGDEQPLSTSDASAGE